MKRMLAEGGERSPLRFFELRQAYPTPVHSDPTQTQLDLHFPLLRLPPSQNLNTPEQGDVATATATKQTRLHRAFTYKALELTLTSQAALYTTSLTIGRARTSSRAQVGQTPSSAPTRLTSQGMRQATQYCATAA